MRRLGVKTSIQKATAFMLPCIRCHAGHLGLVEEALYVCLHSAEPKRDGSLGITARNGTKTVLYSVNLIDSLKPGSSANNSFLPLLGPVK